MRPLEEKRLNLEARLMKVEETVLRTPFTGYYIRAATGKRFCFKKVIAGGENQIPFMWLQGQLRSRCMCRHHNAPARGYTIALIHKAGHGRPGHCFSVVDLISGGMTATV